MNRIYNISFLFYSKDATYRIISESKHLNKQQGIAYEVGIKTEDKISGQSYLITRTPQIVTPKVDNPYMEIIALAGELWKELKLQINRKGQITRIVNFKEVQNYWEHTLKFQISSMYKGDVVNTIIRQLDIVMSDEQHFISKMRQDIFFYNWLEVILGEYIEDPYTQIYHKSGNKYAQYKITKTSTKGTLLSGQGRKSKEELDRLKEQWKLDSADELYYEEQIECDLNRDSEILSFVRQETYILNGNIYHTEYVNIARE